MKHPILEARSTISIMLHGLHLHTAAQLIDLDVARQLWIHVTAIKLLLGV